MSVTAGALDARFRDLARPLARIAAATGVMAAAVVLVVAALREVGVGSVGILLAGIATGAAVFLPLLLRLEPELIAELRGFARHGRRPTDARDEGSVRRRRRTRSREQRISMNRPASDARPVVSFGLPVRNGAATIAQAIESVLAQTFEDWELVISDNLSTDGTSEICAAFAARDERIRHVPTGRDLSIHENFRAAFHHSRGAYFRWQGDDDWLEPQYAERVVAALEASPSSVLCTTVQQYYRDGRALPVNDPLPVLGGVDSTDPWIASRPCSVSSRTAGTSASTPSTRWSDGTSRRRRGLQGSIRDGDFVYSCEMALLGPFVHVPEVLANRRLPGDARGTPASKTLVGRPAWHRFVQREVAILQVAGASEGLPVGARIRIGAALVRFAIREHAHGVRRRARRLASRS